MQINETANWIESESINRYLFIDCNQIGRHVVTHYIVIAKSIFESKWISGYNNVNAVDLPVIVCWLVLIDSYKDIAWGNKLCLYYAEMWANVVIIYEKWNPTKKALQKQKWTDMNIKFTSEFINCHSFKYFSHSKLEV